MDRRKWFWRNRWLTTGVYRCHPKCGYIFRYEKGIWYRVDAPEFGMNQSSFEDNYADCWAIIRKNRRAREYWDR